MNCPINMPSGLCGLCDFGKEGLCDHPYSIKMKPGEIKQTSEQLRALGGKG